MYITHGTSSGRIWIAPAEPNTTYNVKLRVRGKTSQLSTDSGILSITTLDIPRISSMESVIHGEPIVFNVNAPANDSDIKLQLIVDNTEIFNKPVTKGSNSLSMTDEELLLLYSKYGNGSTVSGTFNLITGTYIADRSETITLKGNQKTIRRNVNGGWKKGKLNIKVSGAWKRGVVWEKVSGTWKRGA